MPPGITSAAECSLCDHTRRMTCPSAILWSTDR